ncbi:S-layer homology domain-containing protein [Paenibacillus sp. 598K]|uniref:S-layer homology domain-containing protein n=1 Tax=Paenibacillus sp. 598K TaxID=1117987 RepID=UPI001627D8A7|nr:S-layer homology domain-containing protein [Paenibacillus sp. 598K]
MKRKVAISTLAASMAVTAFAGIPLSSKGLAEKVGIQVNVASAAEIDSAFLTKLNSIHAALHANGEPGVSQVREFRNDIRELTAEALADDQVLDELLSPVWGKISHHFNANDEVAVKKSLLKLVELVAGSYYDPSLTEISNIRQNPDILPGLQIIEDKAEVTAISSDDVINLIKDGEASLTRQLASIENITALLNPNAGSEEREALVRKVIADIKGTSNNKIMQALNALDNEGNQAQDVSVDDLLQVYRNLTGAVPSYENAAKALGHAYVRSQAVVDFTASGLTRTYSIRVFGFNIAEFLTWTSSDSSLISTNKNVLTATASGNTAKITAAFNGRVLFEQNVTISQNVTPPYTGGGGGFPGVPSTPGTETPVDVGGTVDAAVKDLEEILAGLEGASPSEKAELIAKAIDAATVAIDKIASYNAAKSVTVADGVATLNVPEADVQAIIKGIKDILAKLEALAPGSTAQLSPRVVIIQLGAVAEDKVSVNIPQALFTAARDAGLAGFEIVADRLSVTLPASSDFTAGAVNLSIERSNPADEPALEGVRTASSVYSFDITVGGNVITTFVSPVTLKVPVTNTDGLDEELLSLAKIINGGLEQHGGFLRKGFIVEPRTSFSSYVIVENKVSFNDIGSVSAWAGRQIQVMAAKGAIQGRAAGQFVPRDNVTRAEFAKMLISAMNLESNVAKHNFSDVKAGDWFAPYVAAAADLGIINGRTATSFAPNAQITRAEMATMLARTLKITHGLESVADVDGTLASFTDAASIHATLKDGVALAASKELIIGYKGNFMPNDNATRAEAAVMVYRAFNFTE